MLVRGSDPYRAGVILMCSTIWVPRTRVELRQRKIVAAKPPCRVQQLRGFENHFYAMLVTVVGRSQRSKHVKQKDVHDNFLRAGGRVTGAGVCVGW